MRPRNALISTLLAVTVTAVAGCADTSQDARPQGKAGALAAYLVAPAATKSGKQGLGLARISTKSGQIQIVEPDGSITEMVLDGSSPNPFAVTEASLMILNSNLDLDLTGMPALGPVRKRGLTAQQQALAEFAARRRPLLPVLPAGFEPDADMFRGASVEIASRVGKTGANAPQPAADPARDGLVTVRANLRRGLDGNTAFAYATCALAGWAETNGTKYARHVMTQQTRRNGELQIGAVFTLSQQEPLGLKVMNTGQAAQECKTRGIPAT